MAGIITQYFKGENKINRILQIQISIGQPHFACDNGAFDLAKVPKGSYKTRLTDHQW